ncbi:MAG: hypothetical protein CSB55_00325 [Candidatus Cloacimonadota bacterium]|nr:MAG: hypothetical protein CSB55_00325 [Candidatus Cloacimonadota bacterium]
MINFGKILNNPGFLLVTGGKKVLKNIELIEDIIGLTEIFKQVIFFIPYEQTELFGFFKGHDGLEIKPYGKHIAKYENEIIFALDQDKSAKKFISENPGNIVFGNGKNTNFYINDSIPDKPIESFYRFWKVNYKKSETEFEIKKNQYVSGMFANSHPHLTVSHGNFWLTPSKRKFFGALTEKFYANLYFMNCADAGNTGSSRKIKAKSLTDKIIFASMCDLCFTDDPEFEKILKYFRIKTIYLTDIYKKFKENNEKCLNEILTKLR